MPLTLPALLAAAADSALAAAAGDVSILDWDSDRLVHWLRTGGMRILVIIVFAFVVRRLAHMLINRVSKLADDGDPATISRREKRAGTLSGILKQLVRLVVGGGATIMVLRQFGVDIGPIIAGAGVIGLAVGFGAQSLVKDIIAGFFILLEEQFDVGDVVRGGGVQGVVEGMNLRFTKLRDLQGEVHFIPNGEFRVVSNLTRGWSRAVVDVAVDYGTDVDQAVGVLREVGQTLQDDAEIGWLLVDPVEVLGVESLADAAVTIRVFLKARPGRQGEVAREFRRRVKERFDALGIQIPFPQRTLRISYSDAESSASRGGRDPSSGHGTHSGSQKS